MIKVACFNHQPTPMPHPELIKKVERLFREVESAHHQAFLDSDGVDPEWQLWYAEYLQIKLGKLLKANFSKSELTALIVNVASEQAHRAPGANWARYYTKYFLERYI